MKVTALRRKLMPDGHQGAPRAPMSTAIVSQQHAPAIADRDRLCFREKNDARQRLLAKTCFLLPTRAAVVRDYQCAVISDRHSQIFIGKGNAKQMRPNRTVFYAPRQAAVRRSYDA